MHQDTALGQRLGKITTLPDESDAFWLIPLIRKGRRILKDENRPSRTGEALAGRLKMPTQYVLLADVIVGEEPICRFRTCPVLAGKWDRLLSVFTRDDGPVFT
jgi:hypothetical protein